MKNRLFSDNLSPIKESILAKMIDNLMDKEKALMNTKKSLIDRDNALIEVNLMKNKQLSSVLEPFEFEFDVNDDFPLHDGGNAIFKRDWLIDTIAKMILKKVEGRKFGSYYWRAPRGSGKTVFLKLIGKALQDRGCIVYNTIVSPKLDLIPNRHFHKLAEKAGEKAVVVLIDEVQLNMNSFHWGDLLKGNKPSNLLVLGVGIPKLDMISIPFSWKFPRDGDQYPMFLTRKDLPEVIAYFAKQSNSPEETVALICDQVLYFTSGQLFPFVTIMKYVLDPSNNVDVANVTPHLNTEIFRMSQAYSSIDNRCFDLQGSGILQSATNVLSNKESVGDFDVLEKIDIINNGAFVSPLVMNEVFLSLPPPNEAKSFKLDNSESRKPYAEQVILAGLYHMTDTDFLDAKYHKVAVENAISMAWGNYVKHALPNVVVSFQPRTMYEDRKVRGAKPLIDFIFDGRIDLGIEVALNLNADGIKEHLDRFDNKYSALKKNGVVLHIDTESETPKLIEKSLDENEDPNDKIYTFLKRRNALYRGSELVASNVSVNLQSPLSRP